jgi:hypothetical protein
MRRILLGGLGVAALVAGAPASALAQHHGQHGSHHRSHHATKVRFEQFGPPVATPSSSGATGLTGPTGSTTTATPSQDAGTVATFANNVLTIKLNDGSTVSGLVSTDTQIVCTTATAQMADAGGGSGSSDGNGGDHGSRNGGDNGDQNDNQGDDDQGQNNQAPTCDSTSLIPGAVVHEAELRVSSSGSQFMDIVLSQ